MRAAFRNNRMTSSSRRSGNEGLSLSASEKKSLTDALRSSVEAKTRGRNVRKERAEHDMAVVTIQTNVRGRQSRVAAQREKEMAKRTLSATKIQAQCRGRKTRKKNREYKTFNQ